MSIVTDVKRIKYETCLGWQKVTAHFFVPKRDCNQSFPALPADRKSKRVHQMGDWEEDGSEKEMDLPANDWRVFWVAKLETGYKS